jgi:single-stranded-DNA-specific exonuclease
MDLSRYKKIVDQLPPVPRIAPAIASTPFLERTARSLASHIKRAHSDGRIITFFGDFDVDGQSSSAILFLFLRLCDVIDLVPFTSQRLEGYGLTEPAVQKIIKETAEPHKNTVVLMDLGISTTQQAQSLLQVGFSVIVIDHHVPRPGVRADWQKLIEIYGEDKVIPFDPIYSEDPIDHELDLSAAGLVFALAMYIIENNLENLSDIIFAKNRHQIHLGQPTQTIDCILNTISKIAAMAQAADCIKYKNANGTLSTAWHQAKAFEETGPLMAGVQLLWERTNTASLIGWRIGPILNAGGRIGDATKGFELLVETDPAAAAEKLKELEALRTGSGGVQDQTRAATLSLAQDRLTSGGGIEVFLGDYHQGIVGIVAARGADLYMAPTLYLTMVADSSGQDFILKGSMRAGMTDFSCEGWINELKKRGLLLSGGGHKKAAGLSLKDENLQALVDSAQEQRFNITVPPVYEITVEGAIKYHEDVKKVFPFGTDHESAMMLVTGELNMVVARTTSKSGTPVAFKYELSITDHETGRSGVFHVKAADLTTEIKERFNALVGKSPSLGIEVLCVVYDDYIIDNKWKSGAKRSEISLMALSSIDEEGNESKKTPIRLFDKKELNKKKIEPPKVEKKPLSAAIGEAMGASPGESQGMVDNQSANLDQAMAIGTAGTEVTSGGIGTAGDQAFSFLNNEDKRINIQIDWDESLNIRTFILRRPSKSEIATRWGDKVAEELYALHGGAWDPARRCFIITSGIFDTLTSKEMQKSDKFKVFISPKAQAHFELLKKELSE